MNARIWASGIFGGLVLAGSIVAQAPLPVAPPIPAAPIPMPVTQTAAEAPAAPARVAPATTTTKAAAVVNGEAISFADLELAMKQAGPAPVQLPETRKKQMQFELLGLLLDEALMRQFLSKNAPPVTSADIDKKMAELADGLKKQGKSIADLCRETNQTEAQFRANLGYRIQWEHYTEARITEADVNRYYLEYRDFFDGNAVKASHIVLRVAPDAPAAEVDATKTKLQSLRADLLAKKIDFVAAAKQHSQCKSAENGGDIGFIPRKWAVEDAFARVAFALPVGQISDVVRTDYGLHVIQVTERKPGTPSEYEKIKEQVRECYKEDLRLQLLAQQRRTAKIEINVQ